MSVRRDEHVRGVQAAVNDPPTVQGGERIDDLDAELDDPLGRKRTSPERGLEQVSFEQLADDEGLAGVLPGIVNRADVRVTDEGGDVRLAPEAFALVASRRPFRAQQPDGHVALEPLIARPVDLARIVLPDSLEQPVMRDRP